MRARLLFRMRCLPTGRSWRGYASGRSWRERTFARLLLSCFDVLVRDEEKLALAHLIPSALIVRLHHLAGDGVDELLAEAVSGLSIDLPE